MNYELAKELKDAGYPQDGRKYPDTAEERDGVLVEFPLLSELIEAVKEYIHSIEFRFDFWEVNNEYQGSTPEEAVARLWLSLNKK